MKETHQIKDLAQVRLLSDPLKLRLLSAFAEKPMTTKQVAQELGEKLTKLYRHVDALYDSGLLEIVAEKQKRGAVERTFRAVAQRFEADHSLFADDGSDEGTAAARTILRAGEAEILGVLRSAKSDWADRAMVMRVRGKASPKQFMEFRESLQKWVDSLPGPGEPHDPDAKDIGGLIAFYTL